MMHTNKYENFINNQVDRRGESDLQRRLEEILPAVKKQYQDFKDHGHEKLWQMKNETIIEVVKEARGFLSEFGGSELVKNAMEDEKVESDFDNARSLAFCRLIEVHDKRSS